MGLFSWLFSDEEEQTEVNTKGYTQMMSKYIQAGGRETVNGRNVFDDIYVVEFSSLFKFMEKDVGDIKKHYYDGFKYQGINKDEFLEKFKSGGHVIENYYYFQKQNFFYDIVKYVEPDIIKFTFDDDERVQYQLILCELICNDFSDSFIYASMSIPNAELANELKRIGVNYISSGCIESGYVSDFHMINAYAEYCERREERSRNRDTENNRIAQTPKKDEGAVNQFVCQLCNGENWKKEDGFFKCMTCGCRYSPAEMLRLKQPFMPRQPIWKFARMDFREKNTLINIDNKAELEKMYYTKTIYESSYLCPNCGEFIHKTNFPVGKEYEIKTERGSHKMKRVFVCTKCKVFYTSFSDKLNEGAVYQYEAENGEMYDWMIKEFTDKGVLARK